MMLLYCAAAVYFFIGVTYCINARKYLPRDKWIAVFSIYILSLAAVLAQLVKPYYLIEMFSTALGLLMIMLLVIRPEETLDESVNISSWKAYKDDLRRILLSRHHVQIVVIKMQNAAEIRSYIGEDIYNQYVMDITEEIHKIYRNINIQIDVYFERPGTY